MSGGLGSHSGLVTIARLETLLPYLLLILALALKPIGLFGNRES